MLHHNILFAYLLVKYIGPRYIISSRTGVIIKVVTILNRSIIMLRKISCKLDTNHCWKINRRSSPGISKTNCLSKIDGHNHSHQALFFRTNTRKLFAAHISKVTAKPMSMYPHILAIYMITPQDSFQDSSGISIPIKASIYSPYI